jgi:hypothetical protein
MRTRSIIIALCFVLALGVFYASPVLAGNPHNNGNNSAVSVDFDTFPDNGECVSGTEITDQYDSAGVQLFSGASSCGPDGLFCLAGPNPGTTTDDITPTTSPNFGGLLDDLNDLTRSGTGWIEADIFPFATDFCVDLLDVEASGGLNGCGDGNTFIDVTLWDGNGMATQTLDVDCAGNNSQQEICFSAPNGSVITTVFFSLNDGKCNGESSAIDSLDITRGEGCWLTSGGQVNTVSGKSCNGNGSNGDVHFSFGGNVGPPPHGNWNHVDHAAALHFHSNDAHIVECFNDGGPGPSPPKADPNVALFAGTGTVKDIEGKILYDDCTFDAVIKDRGEPGKKDQYGITVECVGAANPVIFVDAENPEGVICGGNLQIHKPNPSLN